MPLKRDANASIRMAGRFLLDTNIAIALLENERQALQHLAEADEVYLPAIGLGELFYGARRSARSEQNVAVIYPLTQQP